MLSIDLDLDHAEASALLRCESRAVLDAHGFDIGFWTCMDEGPVEDCVALIGHRAGKKLDRGWKVKPLRADRAGDAKKTDDAEAMARFDGWVYVFGSHFGSKKGPLSRKRAFVSRFREAGLDARVGDGATAMEIARRPFRLHRVINDGLRASGIEPIPLGPKVRERYIHATMHACLDADRPFAADVRVEDWPINVEGSVFLPDGTLVLGLRFPVSAEGAPLLAWLRNVPGWLDGRGQPEVIRFRAIEGIGERGRPTGVRDLELDGDTLHLLTGPIGTVRRMSSVEQDYPGSRDTPCAHYRVDGSGTDDATVVRAFADRQNLEGLSRDDDDRWYYIADEDDKVLIYAEEG